VAVNGTKCPLLFNLKIEADMSLEYILLIKTCKEHGLSTEAAMEEVELIQNLLRIQQAASIVGGTGMKWNRHLKGKQIRAASLRNVLEDALEKYIEETKPTPPIP
jgi:hypothetical protein